MNEAEIQLVESLESRVGYAFARRDLALTALTHKSWVNETKGTRWSDNERLEFLGDAVVDLAVSRRLMERLPNSQEGELSRVRAGLVNTEALAAVASSLHLGDLLRLGKGEEQSGGRHKQSLLANALEAVVGALYLADGMDPVMDFVDRFVVADRELTAARKGRDHKTRIQEVAQALTGAIPHYRVVSEEGPDHDKTFEMEVRVGDEVIGRGRGHSKKEAEQAAAEKGLEVLARRQPEEKS